MYRDTQVFYTLESMGILCRASLFNLIQNVVDKWILYESSWIFVYFNCINFLDVLPYGGSLPNFEKIKANPPNLIAKS